MGIFDGLGKAQTFERGSYLNPGIYDVAIGRCVPKQSQKSGLGLIAELEVLQSTYRWQADPKNQGRTWQNTPAGTAGTWWQGMTDRNVAMPAIKSFCYAVLGLRAATDAAMCAELDSFIPGSNPPIALIENLMTMATSAENILGGLLVHVECEIILTKKGEDFTVYNWQALNFGALGIPGPNAREIMNRARTVVSPWAAPPQTGWGAPQGYGPPPGPPGFGGPPPGWGPPPGPPAWGPPAPAWGQPPAAPGWGPPAGPPGPPPPPAWPPRPAAPPPPAWAPPPGAEVSPDRRWWRYPGQGWTAVPLPSGDIPF